MEVDINEFKARLEKEKAQGNRRLSEFVQQEIRLAENMKASLMEEMTKKTEDFLTVTAAKLDTYVFQLQEIEKNLGLSNLGLDQQTALKDELVRKKIAERMETLEELKPDIEPEDHLPNPD